MEKKDKLDQERKDRKISEFLQADMHLNWITQKNKSYDFPAVSHWVLTNKKDEDLLLLQVKLTEWHNAEKSNASQKEVLIDLIQKVWRIESYCRVLETIVQESTALLVDETESKKEIESIMNRQKLDHIMDKRKLNDRIKALEKEIEFLNK